MLAPLVVAVAVEDFVRKPAGIGGTGGGCCEISISCSPCDLAPAEASDATREPFFAAPLAARLTFSLAFLLFCAAAAPPGFPSLPSRVGLLGFFFLGVVGSEADAEAAARLASSSAFNLRGRIASSFLSFLLPDGADGTFKTSPSGPYPSGALRHA